MCLPSRSLKVASRMVCLSLQCDSSPGLFCVISSARVHAGNSSVYIITSLNTLMPGSYTHCADMQTVLFLLLHAKAAKDSTSSLMQLGMINRKISSTRDVLSTQSFCNVHLMVLYEVISRISHRAENWHTTLS